MHGFSMASVATTATHGCGRSSSCHPTTRSRSGLEESGFHTRLTLNFARSCLADCGIVPRPRAVRYGRTRELQHSRRCDAPFWRGTSDCATPGIVAPSDRSPA